jgi:O-antigen ligase
VLIVVVVVFAFTNSAVRTRWQELNASYNAQGVQGVGNGRLFLWDQAWSDFRASPPERQLLGSGLGASSVLTSQRIGTPFTAHTDLLEMLVSVGVLGSAVLVSLLIALGRALLRANRVLRRHGEEALATLAVSAAAAFGTAALLTGFFAYAGATVPGMAMLGYALGRADAARTTEPLAVPAE